METERGKGGVRGDGARDACGRSNVRHGGGGGAKGGGAFS